MALLEVADIHTYYGNIEALKGVSLEVEEGEIVTLIGSNGAGKSTTLRSISGLNAPRKGTIRFDGRDITHTPAPDIVPAAWRSRSCSRGSSVYTRSRSDSMSPSRRK